MGLCRVMPCSSPISEFGRIGDSPHRFWNSEHEVVYSRCYKQTLPLLLFLAQSRQDAQVLERRRFLRGGLSAGDVSNRTTRRLSDLAFGARTCDNVHVVTLAGRAGAKRSRLPD